ncbi:MAG: molybdenum cofactor biosynthesis protein MoaE [Parasphingorhabdus sp.]
MSSVVELLDHAFDPSALLAAFSEDVKNEGAIVSFTGHARSETMDGKKIDALILEKYRGVTLASMQAIAEDAHARFDISRSHIVHRAGKILPTEPIVFVITASSHRRAAFEAADYLMDRLKTEAVFWKREEGPSRRNWIEPTKADQADNARWRRMSVKSECPALTKTLNPAFSN